jgi:group I intron endonuclease
MAHLTELEITYKCYKITNIINNKIYIGQTKLTVEQRFKEHYRTMQRGSKYAIHRAIRKYGIDNFKIELLFEFNTREEVDKKEIELIAEYECLNKKKGYNTSKGGSGGDTLSYHENKEEIFKKQTESREIFYKNNPDKNKKRIENLRKAYDANKQNVINCIKQRWADDDFKKTYIENHSIGDKNPFYGKHHSDKTKKILSEKLKISMNRPETIQKLKSVVRKKQDEHYKFIKIDLDKLKQLSHLKISELSNIFNVSPQTITRRLIKLGLR